MAEDWRREWNDWVQHKRGTLSGATILAADAALRELEIVAEGRNEKVAYLARALEGAETERDELRVALDNTQARMKEAQGEVERLTADLAVNARLLARQCDLAREAETERDQLRGDLAEALLHLDECHEARQAAEAERDDVQARFACLQQSFADSNVLFARCEADLLRWCEAKQQLDVTVERLELERDQLRRQLAEQVQEPPASVVLSAIATEIATLRQERAARIVASALADERFMADTDEAMAELATEMVRKAMLGG